MNDLSLFYKTVRLTTTIRWEKGFLEELGIRASSKSSKSPMNLTNLKNYDIIDKDSIFHSYVIEMRPLV